MIDILPTNDADWKVESERKRGSGDDGFMSLLEDAKGAERARYRRLKCYLRVVLVVVVPYYNSTKGTGWRLATSN